MSIKRRHFLIFLGAGAGSLALQPVVQTGSKLSAPFQPDAASAQDLSSGIPFRPIKGTMPLTTDGIETGKQISEYTSYAVADDLVLPEGFTYDVIASWGDPVGDSRFGYNNDFVSFIQTGPDEGYLAVNFEYVSPTTWLQSFESVIGKPLPVADIQAAVEAAGDEGIDFQSLPDDSPVKAMILEVAKEALIDQGIGVIGLKRVADGQWVRSNSPADRRITGISGLEDGRYLKSTGPATLIFRKTRAIGYLDELGDRIVGTVNNCAGGTSPWGTIFSAEENFQNYVPEGVHADGTSFNPSEKTFSFSVDEMSAASSIFGLAANKYGWMVEVDPANPDDYGTKHTWLGRYRHEAVAIRAEAGKSLAIYSGCDRRGGHLYKFVSRDTVVNPTSKTNSRLLDHGMLHAAKFNPDGTGRWIALNPDTPVDPDMPSVHAGGMITLPKRPDGGFDKVTDDAAAQAFKAQYSTLGNLYVGMDWEKQGAILIDAHYAANAAGATCTARPEDTELMADGSLFIAFTSGSPSSSDGSPNTTIFMGPNGESPYEHGWIMKLVEDGNDPASMSFKWELFATGGEPAEGGLGFSNPDNLLFDPKGNLWMVTDMSTDKHNKEIPSRVKSDGTAVSQSDLRGLFGNNTVWFMPTSGPNVGEAYLFAYGPMECEICGPFMTADSKTLFLAPQHPGEYNGIRQGMNTETRMFAMKALSGEEFMQTREVPIGSNWPSKQVDAAPKPSVVAVRRIDGSSIV